MPPQPDQPSAPRPNFGRLFQRCFDGLGYSVEVIIRADIGERRCRDMGGPLLLAVGVALAVTAYLRRPGRPEDAEGLTMLFVFCCCSVAAHVHQYFRARRRAQPTHTYYGGTPGLLRPLRRLFPGLGEETCKLWCEPAALLLTGYALLFVCRPLGYYLMAAGGVILLSTAARRRAARELVLDTTDGMIDMLNHHDAVAGWIGTPVPQRPAATVIDAAPAPRPQPAPAPAAPAPDLPAGLYAGLNDNLRHLLQEPCHDQ
jgi:hypothetical protein